MFMEDIATGGAANPLQNEPIEGNKSALGAAAATELGSTMKGGADAASQAAANQNN